MADIAVRILLPKLELLIAKIAREWKQLSKVQQSIIDAKDELESMIYVLRYAEVNGDNKPWVKQVREAAYDIEDIIDNFLLSIGQIHERGFVAMMYKHFHIGGHGYSYYLLSNNLLEIEKRVQNISLRSGRYPSTQAPSDADFDSNQVPVLPLSSEVEIVGLDEARDTIKGWFVSNEPSLFAAAVLGMGGVGKTTLAQQVYEEVTKQLKCAHAWISITHQTKINDLFQSLIKCLSENSKEKIPEGLSTMDSTQLTNSISDFLSSKRYLLVLDNLSNTDHWKSLKRVFCDNKMGSRILVTTRIYTVANSCVKDGDDIYRLQPLNVANSLTLFCKAAYPDLEGKCPKDLLPLSKKIAEKCGGIPLAITVIAGLLPKNKKERTIVRWKQFDDQLPYLLAKHEDLKNMSKVLMLGYNELPYYLKPCFLYFSMFRKGHRIKCMRLIRLWIAEGFVEPEEGMTLEDIAEAYLNELITRNMAQVVRFDLCGQPRSCQVHDLLWDSILKKARDENFSSSLDTSVATIPQKMRRLSIRTQLAEIQFSSDFSHLRSFLNFTRQDCSFPVMQKMFASFRLLKVLDLKRAPVKGFPSEIVHLLFLRYLSLRSTNVNTVPKDIKKLQYLETLDLKGTMVCELPLEIFSLQNLRHLLVYRSDNEQSPSSAPSKQGVKLPSGVKRLVAIQKLFYVDVNRSMELIREIGQLTKLRRIGITGLRQEHGDDLCSAIEMMNDLRSIDIRCVKGQTIKLQKLDTPPSMLQRVQMHGRLSKIPFWISRAENIVKLRLCGSQLDAKDDPFRALESLESLLELHLHSAYDGLELHCGKNGFQSLKVLVLSQLHNLRVVKLGNGAMPDIQTLIITCCENLKEIPKEWTHIISQRDHDSDNVAEKYLNDEKTVTHIQKRELGMHLMKKQRSTLGGSRYEVLMDDEDFDY